MILKKKINILFQVFEVVRLKKLRPRIWVKNVDSIGFDSIIKIQDMELLNAKYLGAWISYNKLNLRESETEHRLDHAMRSFV